MKQEHEMTPGVLVSGGDMSAGDYKARCAVLEAEVAELRQRVCVPEGYRVVPVELINRILSEAIDECYDAADPDDLLAELRLHISAPAPVERVEQEAEDLDSRLRGAGMYSVADLLRGAPLDGFIKHAGVHDIESLVKWAEMRRAECLNALARYDLGDKSKDDELYEWTVAHCAVFAELHVNLRAATETPQPAPTAAQDVAVLHLLERIEKHLTNWLELDICECEFGHNCGYNDVIRDRDALRGLIAAHQSGGAK